MKYRTQIAVGWLAFSLASLTWSADVVSVWGGARGTIILKSDGTVWTWGANFNGKLGIGLNQATLLRTTVPVEVHGPGNVGYLNSITAVMGGEIHNIAVKSDGSVWMWGANDQGQCGDGTTNDDWVPVPVVGLGARVALPLDLRPSVQPGNVDLSWTSATGEYFTVEYTTNLAHGFSGALLSNILATPPRNTVTVPATNGSYFYRLKF